MNTKLTAALSLAALVLALVSPPSAAADPPAVELTGEDKLRADALDRATVLANKEAAAVAAKAALAKAKVDAATPAAAEGITAPSGAVTGANSMTFAMYMASMESLKRVALAICTDLVKNNVGPVFVTGRDVSEAVAKNRALNEGRDHLARSLDTATKKAKDLTAALASAQPASAAAVSAASVSSIASGIDVAAGLVKGVAGLAALFRTERTIGQVDNLLTTSEVSASLSMCDAAPTVRNVDADQVSLAAATKRVSGEVDNISDRAAGLEKQLSALTVEAAKLATLRAADETARTNAEATGKKAETSGSEAEAALAKAEIALAKAEAAGEKVDTAVAKAEIAQAKAAVLRAANAAKRAQADAQAATARVAALDARKPATLDEFAKKAAALVTQAQAFIDAAFQVDATTGLSPLIVAAQLRVVSDAAIDPTSKQPRLVLSLLRSNGYSLTTKRLLLSDRVDYAGGVAVRAAVLNDAGGAKFEKIYFHDSGWIRADFKSGGTALSRQNF